MSSLMLTLACLAGVGHADKGHFTVRPVSVSTADEYMVSQETNPLKTFKIMLQAFQAAGAFNPTHAGLHPAATRSSPTRRTRFCATMSCTRADFLAHASVGSAALLALAASPVFAEDPFTLKVAEESRKSSQAMRDEVKAKQTAIDENAKAINERRRAAGKEADAKRLAERQRIRELNRPKNRITVAQAREELIEQSRGKTQAKLEELQAKQAAIEQQAKEINERRQAAGKEADAKKAAAAA
mmetsp:Transcript_80239/g.139147  ORF Transcript_80239/g.139147 Transcript_80239/m.139147 type:complete len:242 (+) Transcript_80239:108-833(+)